MSQLAFRWRMEGIADTVNRLQMFKRNLRTKVLRKAGNEASKIVLKEMKQNVPVAKGDYGPSGGLKKSMARKVQVKRDRLWYGVGPRTSWLATVAKKFRFWRDDKGRIRKAPLTWTRKEQPSRRAHLSEKKHRYIARTVRSTRAREQSTIKQVLADAMREVAR